MPKYILHGGELGPQNESNAAYLKLMAKEAEAAGGILMCYFSKDTEEKAQKSWQRDSANLAKYTDVKPTLATDENFAEQAAAHQVFYFGGGHTSVLLKRLRAALGEDIVTTFTHPGKTYFGSSAGAYILGRDYFSQYDGLCKGLGMIPYGIIAHHEAEGWTQYQDTTKRQKPLLMLHETQFVVIETADTLPKTPKSQNPEIPC